MTERHVGIVVTGDTVTVVEALIPDEASAPIEIIADTNWTLQAGDRPTAYDVLARRCVNYLRENDVNHVFVKASATTRGSATIALLHSAEVRGVVIAAASSIAPVKMLAKSHISRNYGNRKVDDYVKDDAFWAAQTTGGKLRKTSREATMLLIAARP